MDKKIVIISIVVLILALVTAFLGYRYFMPKETENVDSFINNVPADQQTNQTETAEDMPGVEVGGGGITVEGYTDGGGLTICADKCGDGICQKTNTECSDKNLNCVCVEVPEECPQDCPGN